MFWFWDNCIWIGIVQLSLLRAGYFSSAANVLKSSPKILYVNKGDFCELNWRCSNQWVWWWCYDADFNSAWARLPCCLSKGPIKGHLLDIYLTIISEAVISKIHNLWGLWFFSKCLKFNLDLKNAAKNWEKNFCFWDNCIWKSILKLSLFTTGYLCLVPNVLTRRPTIRHVNTRDFFEHNFVASDQWIWSRCCDADFNSASARLPYCLSKHPLKQKFLDIYLTTISDSVTFKIQNLWGSSFFSKCLKFNLDLKNAAKNWEKKIVSEIIASEKVLLNCLYYTGYLCSVPSVLTRRPTIRHVNTRDFCKHIFCLSKHSLKRDFSDIYLTTYSGSVRAKIQNLWGSYFHSKFLKINLDFKNPTKNWEKVFFFSEIIASDFVSLNFLY